MISRKKLIIKAVTLTPSPLLVYSKRSATPIDLIMHSLMMKKSFKTNANQLFKKIADRFNSKDGIIYNKNTDKAYDLIGELIRSGTLTIESCDSIAKMTSEMSWHLDMAHRARTYLGHDRQKFIDLNTLFHQMNAQEKDSAIMGAKKELSYIQ